MSNDGAELGGVANQRLEIHARRGSPSWRLPGWPGITGWITQRPRVESNMTWGKMSMK